MTVIGVVADSTFGSLREEPQAALYSPARLVGARLPHATLVVRSRHERSDELASAVERAILAAAPSVAITEMRTFQTRITESVRGERVVAILIGGFGATALAVTVIGVFGVLAATMAHRTREIGLRIALGATSRQIARLVFVPAFALLAAGLGLGLVGALIAGRLVSTLLFGVEPADPLSLAIASGALALTVLAACVLPARRAARVDPSQLMRGC